MQDYVSRLRSLWSLRSLKDSCSNEYGHGSRTSDLVHGIQHILSVDLIEEPTGQSVPQCKSTVDIPSSSVGKNPQGGLSKEHNRDRENEGRLRFRLVSTISFGIVE